LTGKSPQRVEYHHVELTPLDRTLGWFE
jgi:hypothetical protein